MLIPAAIAFTIFIIILTFFTSRTLSPIPYYPSNPKDLRLATELLEMQNDQVVFDLGAGDGIVISQAAYHAYKRGLNTEFYAVEINPILVGILFLRRLFHPNRKHIHILWGDLFKMRYSRYIPNARTHVIFYLYISPWMLERATTIIRNLNRKIRIVSYFYPIPSLKEFEQKVEGVHKVYRYEVLP